MEEGSVCSYNVPDDFNRDLLAMEVDTLIPSFWVIWVLNRNIARKGELANIRSDNGPEFISHLLQQWCEDNGITLEYLQPVSQHKLIHRKKKRKY